MKRLLLRLGTACPRLLVLTAMLIALACAPTLVAQDKLARPDAAERTKFSAFKSGDAPVVIEGNKEATEQNRQILDKVARYCVLRLNDPQLRKEAATLHQDLGKQLQLTPHARLRPEQKPFIDEFGKALINHLTGLAINSAVIQVRLNAAWMAADVGKTGYDGAAELYLKILEKENESDGVKLWALRGLNNLFAVVPDPIIPVKTVFQKNNTGVLSPLERRSIQALINFIERKVEMPEGADAQQADAVWYVREEAVKALSQVRVQTVKNLGQVESRPAFVLLKVARKEIPYPSPRPTEQLTAVNGFCRLVPDITTRDLNLDYAAFHIGRAIQDIVVYRVQNPFDTSVSWKATGSWLRESLEHWRTNAENLKLQDARLVKDLVEACDLNCLKPLEDGIAGNAPNIEPLAAWLRANPPKSASLFKNDAATAIQAK